VHVSRGRQRTQRSISEYGGKLISSPSQVELGKGCEEKYNVDEQHLEKNSFYNSFTFNFNYLL